MNVHYTLYMQDDLYFLIHAFIFHSHFTSLKHDGFLPFKFKQVK